MWQNRVYKLKVDERYPSKMEVKKIFKRDNYQCQSCRKRFPVHDLSCHHIIPRAEGGDNHPTNLITLCKPCHDLIELNGIRILSDILYYKKRLDEQEDSQINSQEIADEIEAKADGPTDWHAWVYGGTKRPQ